MEKLSGKRKSNQYLPIIGKTDSVASPEVWLQRGGKQAATGHERMWEAATHRSHETGHMKFKGN
jgi:hypothetical protein